jgi:hypothetical protein
MSRGLGALQREIKLRLDRGFQLFGPLRFVDIRGVFTIEAGGKPELGDRPDPTRERSLKRALKGLVDRGDVVIVAGKAVLVTRAAMCGREVYVAVH